MFELSLWVLRFVGGAGDNGGGTAAVMVVGGGGCERPVVARWWQCD